MNWMWSGHLLWLSLAVRAEQGGQLSQGIRHRLRLAFHLRIRHGIMLWSRITINHCGTRPHSNHT